MIDTGTYLVFGLLLIVVILLVMDYRAGKPIDNDEEMNDDNEDFRVSVYNNPYGGGYWGSPYGWDSGWGGWSGWSGWSGWGGWGGWPGYYGYYPYSYNYPWYSSSYWW